jgi:hypothetical protein
MLHSRTDGHIHCIAFALHCIVLHCITLYCIALHCYCIACITLHYVTCIALHTYWTVMLIVRHVCSWIVPSVTFNKFFAIECITSDRICVFVCLCLSVTFFFWLRTSDGQTYLLYATELKLNWNNWNLSVHPWHSYMQHFTWYFHFSGGKRLHSVRPSSITFRFPF